MVVRRQRVIGTIFFSSLLAASVVPAEARNGDCGQPKSAGGAPTTADCLFILRASTGAAHCFPRCVCNTTGDSNITTTDALLCLRKAVGQAVALKCACKQCSSALIVSAPGSRIDSGWNGLAHEKDLIAGAAITTDVVRKCTDTQEPCTGDADCETGRCRPGCDCDDPNHSTCETFGPTDERRCVRDLNVCTTNDDCTSSRCERFFGPPLPLSAADTPACITTFFEDDLTGTYDAQTGQGTSSAFLRARVHLGIAFDQPCPRCGSPAQNPQVGEVFTCKGGPHDGQPCTVDAVSPVFGGVSNACPPHIASNVSGQGLAVRFRNLTTDCADVTASIPCLADGLCSDNGKSCTTNADCRRCTGSRAACTTNADCTGGTCAAAPEQPITCGFSCHCGFCDNDPSSPCFADDECDAEGKCLPGNASSGRQLQPNGCGDSICGRAEPERCCAAGDPACLEPTPLEGECSEKRYFSCSTDPNDGRFGTCERENAGECIAHKRSCFGSTIERCGRPSPMGDYCVDDPDVTECNSSDDCSIGECVADTAEPRFIALFCIPQTTAPSINAAGGIPGPGVLSIASTVFFCRCGDGKTGCDEQCDDGNLVAGDGCDETCRGETQRGAHG
jgi:cysteine-rich repeat protein